MMDFKAILLNAEGIKCVYIIYTMCDMYMCVYVSIRIHTHAHTYGAVYLSFYVNNSVLH